MFCVIFGLFGIVAAIVLQLLAIPALDTKRAKVVFHGLTIVLAIVSLLLIHLALNSALVMGV